MSSTLKHEIFDLFYGKRMVTRSGGGKIKNKMSRLNPSLEDINFIKNKIKDKKLMNYFNKLLNRDTRIAPPPRPT